MTLSLKVKSESTLTMTPETDFLFAYISIRMYTSSLMNRIIHDVSSF